MYADRYSPPCGPSRSASVPRIAVNGGLVAALVCCARPEDHTAMHRTELDIDRRVRPLPPKPAPNRPEANGRASARSNTRSGRRDPRSRPSDREHRPSAPDDRGRGTGPDDGGGPVAVDPPPVPPLIDAASTSLCRLPAPIIRRRDAAPARGHGTVKVLIGTDGRVKVIEKVADRATPSSATDVRRCGSGASSRDPRRDSEEAGRR